MAVARWGGGRQVSLPAERRRRNRFLCRSRSIRRFTDRLQQADDVVGDVNARLSRVDGEDSCSFVQETLESLGRCRGVGGHVGSKATILSLGLEAIHRSCERRPPIRPVVMRGT